MKSLPIIGVFFVISGFLLSCSKQEVIKPYAILSVNVDDIEIFFETTDANWDTVNHTLTIQAISYYNEIFRLTLTNITGPITFNPPSISQIYFEGLDFVPHIVRAGELKVNHISNPEVSGVFSVSMEDSFNGVDYKQISGGFTIHN